MDGSNFEVLAHNFRNNYELTVDSFGGLWQSDNDDDGNRSVRINFLLEYGNYGYRDEMTGAGWTVPRTNLESEIPARHWHQNDPGTVPNVLITGAGSPVGHLRLRGEFAAARVSRSGDPLRSRRERGACLPRRESRSRLPRRRSSTCSREPATTGFARRTSASRRTAR